MGYAGEREEMIAASVKKLPDRTRALNKVTYTRTLYCPLSTPVMLQNLMLRASMGFFVNRSAPCDCINWGLAKKIAANSFSGSPDVASGTRAFPFGDLRAIDLSRDSNYRHLLINHHATV